MASLLAAVMLPAAAPGVAATAAEGRTPAFVEPYGRLLQRHVTPQAPAEAGAAHVSYADWRADTDHAAAMRRLRSAEPERLAGREQRLAFWINAYNLLTIDLIVRSGERESIRNQGGLFTSVWRKHSWRVGGDAYTLHEIEHELLRPMGEPRIHFAINCASVSCPDLRAEPYVPRRLEQQLAAQEERFLNDPQKGVQRLGDGRVKVSRIFDWFGDDFGGESGVRRLVAGYVEGRSADAVRIVDYLDYDWSLNGSWEPAGNNRQ